MADPILPPLKPIPVKERLSILFIERGQIDVIDGAFVVVDKNGVRTHIPVGGVSCLMLEPGTRVSHAAVTLASRVGCLLVWVGEAGVRLYASGQPGGARADRLLYQAKLALDDTARLKVVRKMYELRFKEKPPERRSIKQLRGIEGARVKKMYELLARQYRVPWARRNYDHTNWGSGDVINRCLSSATACLYGLSEAAILAAGYAPAVGFIHTGKPQSFVYDIADIRGGPVSLDRSAAGIRWIPLFVIMPPISNQDRCNQGKVDPNMLHPGSCRQGSNEGVGNYKNQASG